MMVKWIYIHVEEILVVILVSLMSIVVTLQVFYRLVLHDPLIWSEELATILFVWVVMIGSSLALKRKEHFAVELLYRNLGVLDRRIGTVIVGVALIVFSLLILYEGMKLAWLNMGVTTAAMEISRVYLYAALPVGGFLMLIRSIELLISNYAADGRNNDEKSDEEIIDKAEVSV